jgi:acetoin utilization deacetylase AcuC-like enzyme
MLELRAYSTSAFTLTLPEGHRFPMFKYGAVREALLADGTLKAGCALDAPRADWPRLERAHDENYLRKLRFGDLDEREQRLIGLPWSPGLVERSLRSTGGTLAATGDALGKGLGINLAGGTHHASRARGEGFCLLNDAAVASLDVLDQGLARKIVVLDLDVHQGNGTAEILEGEPRVLTVSVHGERNYPFRKARSGLDVGLGDGVTDDEYLTMLDEVILPAARAFKPDLVYYIAGVDVLAGDRFGRFSLTPDGVLERDRRVFATCREAGWAVVSLMGGGYNRNPALTVLAHANTVRAAAAVFS